MTDSGIARPLPDGPVLSSGRRVRGRARSYVVDKPLIAGAIAIFAILTIVYTFSIGIWATAGASITADEPFYLLTTQSIIHDRDLDLNNQYATRSYTEFFDHRDGLWRQSVPAENGRLLSPHNPGLPLLLVPGYLAGRLAGAQAQMLLITAATFAFTYVLAARLTDRHGLSFLATLGIGITPTAFVYSTELYPEVPAALTLVLGLLIVTRQGRPGVRDAIALTVLLSAMMWLGVKYAPLGLITALVFLVRGNGNARYVFLAASAASGIYFAWFHLETYGGLTPYAVNVIYAGGTSTEIIEQHLALTDRFYRIWGLFIDGRFGLARWAFIVFPAVAGLALLPWHGWRHHVVLVLISTQLLIATFVAITMMGWWFPGRTLAVVLPLLVIPLTLLLAELPTKLRWIAGLLGAHTVATTFALAHAGHAREIRLAVNPFEMNSPVYQGIVWLFPNYTAWDAHTWVTTVAWQLAAILTLGVVTATQRRRRGTISSVSVPAVWVDRG